MGKKNKRNEGVVFATIFAVVLFAAVIGGVLYSQYTPSVQPKTANEIASEQSYRDLCEIYQSEIDDIKADIDRLPDYSNERQNARKELEVAERKFASFRQAHGRD